MYQFLEQYHDAYKDLHPWVVGVVSAITGLLLMKTSIHFSNNVIGDIRNVIILIAGLIGGPLSIVVSSVLIGLFRIYITGITTTSIFAGLDTTITGLILALFAKWKPISIRNMHYYLAYSIILFGFGIIFLSKDSESRLLGISTLLFTSIPALYITVFVLNQSRKQFERIHVIEKLADTDYLTDLPNSRKFKSIVDEFIVNREHFTLLLIDIDHFRKVNSTYGHLVGDEILKQIGYHLKQFVLEHEDTNTARISGEEFYVACKEVAPAFGLQYAYEISKMISQNPFISSNGRKIPITVSIGVANFPDNGKSIPELAAATDQALMKAVSQGNNKIMHYNNIHV